MHAQGAVAASALQANQGAVVDRGPVWIVRVAVHAPLIACEVGHEKEVSMLAAAVAAIMSHQAISQQRRAGGARWHGLCRRMREPLAALGPAA